MPYAPHPPPLPSFSSWKRSDRPILSARNVKSLSLRRNCLKSAKSMDLQFLIVSDSKKSVYLCFRERGVQNGCCFHTSLVLFSVKNRSFKYTSYKHWEIQRCCQVHELKLVRRTSVWTSDVVFRKPGVGIRTDHTQRTSTGRTTRTNQTTSKATSTVCILPGTLESGMPPHLWTVCGWVAHTRLNRLLNGSHVR